MSVACWGLLGVLPGRSPRFTLRACMMRTVNVYPCAITRTGRPTPITDLHVAALLDEVNVIFRQVGLRFVAGDLLRVVENSVWAERGLSDMSVGVAIRNVMQGTDGLEVYFISGNGDNGGHTGSHQRTGIVVLNEVSARTLAHEIGHACGLHDIFNDRDCFADDMRESWMPSDWNNGTGHGFYDSFHSQRLLIARLLMYGITSSDKADVTAGSVYGRDGTGVCSNVLVGRSGMLFYPPISR